MKFHDAWLTLLLRPLIRVVNPAFTRVNVECSGGFLTHLSTLFKIYNALTDEFLSIKAKTSPFARLVLTRRTRTQHGEHHAMP